MRNFTIIDNFLSELDLGLRTLFPPEQRTAMRPNPSHDLKEIHLNMAERKHIAALVRVNHAGEVCAQALYQGQGLTAQLKTVKVQMEQAALEETDHLAWCEERLRELGGSTSQLNLLWYFGSLCIGALAGLAGDKVSLGFVAETEKQVSAHLQKHLQKLPSKDKKTKAILEQMEKDEKMHAKEAKEAGGVVLPEVVQGLMQQVSKLMTVSSYYL